MTTTLQLNKTSGLCTLKTINYKALYIFFDKTNITTRQMIVNFKIIIIVLKDGLIENDYDVATN